MGECKIIAESDNGTSTECTVKVLQSLPTDIIATDIEFDSQEKEINVGNTAILNAIVLPEETTNKRLQWASKNPEVAIVDENGVITGMSGGETQIIATTTDGSMVSSSINIKVNIPVTGITINTNNVNLKKGDSTVIQAKIMPNDATNKLIQWSTSDENVVTIENGIVTAKNIGKATITATTLSENISASLEINVIIPAESITIIPDELSLNKGDTHALQIKITPDDTTNKKVKVTIDDEKIVIVDENGIITARDKGETTIKVETTDGSNLLATTKVNVTTPVTEITFNTYNIYIKEGEEKNIVAKIDPDDATDKSLQWTSSDEDIAIVDGNGKVTGLAEGVTTIKTQSSNGIKTECTVNVEKTYIPDVLTQKIELNNDYIKNMSPGEKQTLTVTITPDNASNKRIIWTSGDSSIATIDSNGILTAKKGGTVQITATTTDGTNLNATITIDVNILATQLTLNTNSMTIEKEDNSQRLDVTIYPSNATNKNVILVSSNEEVATVDESGRITALKVGETVITATTTDGSNLSQSVNVKVTIPVTEIALNKNSTILDLNNFKSETLTATILPEDAENKGVTWSSSNTSIVTVDNNGVLTAKAVGNAKITATSSNGKTDSCDVEVQMNPTGITLNKTNIALDLTKTKTVILTPTISPTMASNKKIIWSSSDNNVATVTNYGEVTAIGNGTATITATTINGKTATCNISVGTNPTEVILNNTSAQLDLNETKTIILEATIAPTTASNKTLIWSSSNNNVATVTNNGIVTAIGNGTATITVKTLNDKSASCDITVETSPTGVTLNKASTTLNLNGTETLTATVTPITANNKTVTWSSGNSNIATVTSDGVVKAVASGTAIITARTSNGKTATCNVTVQISPTGITLSKTSVNITGKSDLLTATVSPQNASNKTVTWTSDNTKVATVSNGSIKAVGPGTAIITASTVNGITTRCTVTVSTNILFIGNSKTYYNRMPEKVFTPIAQIGGKNIYVATITSGSKTLLWHYNNRDNSEDIRETGTNLTKTVQSNRWDYVVLQEQTEASYNNFTGLKEGVTNIVKLLRNNGSPNVKIIYNAIWMNLNGLSASERKKSDRSEIIKASGSIYKLQKQANDNYRALVKELGGTIAYSGKAFIWCWRDNEGKDIQLYRSATNDWNHPSVWGGYLEACCIYSAIFGKPANDIIIAKAWNYKPGYADEAYTITTHVQQVLWKIVRQVQ